MTEANGLCPVDRIGTTVYEVSEQTDRRNGGRTVRQAAQQRSRSPEIEHRHRATRGRHRLSEDVVRRKLDRAAAAGAGSVIGLRRGNAISDQRSPRNFTASMAGAWNAVGRALWTAMNAEPGQR